MTDGAARIAIIGGSGITDLFEPGERESRRVATPWGAPSGPIESGRIAGTPVLFIARHGPGHSIPPHRVNYRANIDALRSLGAESILAVNSVGSLRQELPPGTFVLPDQFVDLTRQRSTTFHEGGEVVHVSMADPFCPRILASAVTAGRTAGAPLAAGKTYVCVEGPRFSTRAESRWFRSFADVIGMTLVPEATLARERALCYACLAMVTDFDVWAERPVAAAEITRTMRANAERMRRLLAVLVPGILGPRDCPCPHALDEAKL